MADEDKLKTAFIIEEANLFDEFKFLPSFNI